MIAGIPYFGEDNNTKYKEIIEGVVEHSKSYDSLYDLVMAESDNNPIVVVDNKWLTWFNDIVFNYRDKECYIPYYEYQIYHTDSTNLRTDNKGHLLLAEDGTLGIRYNFIFKKCDIDINKMSFILYNTQTSEKYQVAAKRWYNDKEFSIRKLHSLYVDSSYAEDDFVFNKHSGGYHYINKTVKGFRNKENNLREEYNLQTYSNEHKYIRDYRDVRSYTYEEVVIKEGMREGLDLYKIRRLRFESYLYCVLRQHSEPDDKEFKKEWNKLGKTRTFIKYGDNIKLIIKSYWLDEYNPVPKKSWSRV